MGFLDLFKRKRIEKKKDFNVLSSGGMVEYIQSNLKEPTNENVLKVVEKVAKPENDLEHLTSEGELPWGWHSHNKEFTNKVDKEYSHFLDMWLDSRNKSPKKQFESLKSFVLYLEKLEKLCVSKGECYEFYFYELIASKDYIQKRKEELEYLTEHFDYLQDIYNKKQNLKPIIIELLKKNDGILQSEFKKMFEEPLHSEVSNILYEMHQNGEIEKVKSGRSYILHYKEGV